MPDGTTGANPRILLAEEQAAARDLMKLVLGRLDYRLEIVSSGGRALAQAQRSPADLILLSTTLPDMPGASLIGALRQLGGIERVPVVAICQGGPDVRKACMVAGAAACLSRPLEIERLLRLIERLVRPCSRAGVGAQEPVLDFDHLHQFTDGDAQLEGELGTLFLSTANVYLRDMSEALQSGRSWTSIAHALKGASGNLGARRIATLALVAERSEPSRAQLDAIARAVDEVRELFRDRGAARQPEASEAGAQSSREIP
jgi:CheY-like chemotaxis protein